MPSSWGVPLPQRWQAGDWKAVFPTSFLSEIQPSMFPTLLQGLTRNLFRAPDFVFPPPRIRASICKWYHLSAYCHLPPAHPFIKCLQLGTGLPCPACSIVPSDPGEGACEHAGSQEESGREAGGKREGSGEGSEREAGGKRGGRGREEGGKRDGRGREAGALPSPEPGGRGAPGQLRRDNGTGRLTAPPPRLALTDDLAGTAALGLPTDISWYNGLDWTCHPGNVGGKEIIPARWK